MISMERGFAVDNFGFICLSGTTDESSSAQSMERIRRREVPCRGRINVAALGGHVSPRCGDDERSDEPKTPGGDYDPPAPPNDLLGDRA